jgi:hypothetical protein
MKVRVNLRELLSPNFIAVHTTKTPKGTTRWYIFDANNWYCGTLVRWHKTPANPETWSFQASSIGRNAFTEGTIAECLAAFPASSENH